MLLSKCTICSCKKTRFMKELEAKALVGSFKELKHNWEIFHC